MNHQQWQKAWEIFGSAYQLPEEQRSAYLASIQTVQTDPDVLKEVFAMLEQPDDEREAAEELPKAPPRTGSTFSRYEIRELLGSGGMGQVYSGLDPGLGRMVAIKFLVPELAANRESVERLVREAKAASALNHPNIVTVHEVIRDGDDLAIAMELVEGDSLRRFCSTPPQAVSVVRQWVSQIAKALAAAHEQKIIHCDIKPENVMVRGDGLVKVLDFGLARYSGLGSGGRFSNSTVRLAGTLAYMAPEQTRAETATTASDVFSLGLVLFELLTGRHPFQADSPIDTAYTIAHEEPVSASMLNPHVPAALNDLVLTMLLKDPLQRPSALSVEQRLLEGNVAPARRPSRRMYAVSAAISVAAIAGLSMFLFHGERLAHKEPTLKQLTTQVNENRVTAAAISPDGKYLAFASFSGPIYLRRMSDGSRQTLNLPDGLRVDRISWFADGGRLVVSGAASGANEPGIWVVSTAGGNAQRIVAQGKEGVPSPDGAHIALCSVDGSMIWVTGPDGGAARQIRSGGQNTAFSSLIWSPDSKRLGYQRLDSGTGLNREQNLRSAQLERRYRYGYESVDVASGGIAASAEQIVMVSACALADGRILFLRWIDPEHTLVEQLWELRTEPATGKILGNPVRLTSSETNTLSSISASSDGKTVVAVRQVNGWPNIYLADVQFSGQRPRLVNSRRLTFAEAEEFPHAWSADSRSVIFESNRGGSFDIYRQRMDGGDAEPLVASSIFKAMPYTSPDGGWVLFHEEQNHRRWKVMRVARQGGAPQTVSTNGKLVDEFRCGMRAGARCVVRRVENDQFIFSDLDPIRGEGRELARTAWSATVVGDWSLSPDGVQVAIPNHDSHSATIRLISLDAAAPKEEKTITLRGMKNLNGIAWAADGQGWFSSFSDTSLRVLSYADPQGEVWKLLESAVLPTYAVPSPDGRRIAFPEWTVSSNAWLIEGL